MKCSTETLSRLYLELDAVLPGTTQGGREIALRAELAEAEHAIYLIDNALCTDDGLDCDVHLARALAKHAKGGE